MGGRRARASRQAGSLTLTIRADGGAHAILSDAALSTAGCTAPAARNGRASQTSAGWPMSPPGGPARGAAGDPTTRHFARPEEDDGHHSAHLPPARLPASSTTSPASALCGRTCRVPGWASPSKHTDLADLRSASTRTSQTGHANSRRSERCRARERVTLCNSRWSAPSARVAADLLAWVPSKVGVGGRPDQGILRS
jgi:hypothetical protein